MMRMSADGARHRVHRCSVEAVQERRAPVVAENIAHMAPMLLLAGLMAGWTAEAVSRAGGSTGSSVIWVSVSPGVWRAALVITAQRSLWRSVRPGT